MPPLPYKAIDYCKRSEIGLIYILARNGIKPKPIPNLPIGKPTADNPALFF
jgi:hypothetical protein